MAEAKKCESCGKALGPKDQKICPACEGKAKQAAGGPSTSASGRKKILIVDDDADLRSMLLSRIRSLGYDGMVATNGLTALEMIEGQKPDLILLDVLMPEMTGYDFVKRLKEISGASEIPVILITGRRSMKDFFNAWDIHSVLIKPFQTQDLIAQIKDALKEAIEASPASTRPILEEKPPEKSAGKKILLLVYQEYIREKLRGHLEKKQCSVAIASEASEAVQEAASSRPDVILGQYVEDPSKMDIETIYHKLQENSLTRPIPFVAICDQGLSLDAVKIFKPSQLITFDKVDRLTVKVDEFLNQKALTS